MLCRRGEKTFKLIAFVFYSTDMCPTKTATTTNTNDEESDTSDYSSDTAPTPYGSSFFEGVEKLLEVWFTTVDGDIKSCDLRRIPR